MRSLLIAVAVLMLVGVAYADQTSGATYTSPNGEVCDEFIGFINEQEYIDHTHQFGVEEREDVAVGLGADLVVWENDEDEKPTIEAVEIQGKYDVANEETSVFVVAKINLFNMWNREKPVE